MATIDPYCVQSDCEANFWRKLPTKSTERDKWTQTDGQNLLLVKTFVHMS